MTVYEEGTWKFGYNTWN